MTDISESSIDAEAEAQAQAELDAKLTHPDSVWNVVYAAVDEVNERYRLPKHYALRAQYEPGEVWVAWGNPRQAPNGHRTILWRPEIETDEEMKARLRREVDRTGLMAALIVGRDQELRNQGIDPADCPIWARAGTPMLKLLVERILERGDDLHLIERGAIMHPLNFVRVADRCQYFFSWWHDVEGFVIPSPQNELVRSGIVGAPLEKIIDNGGEISFGPIIEVKSVSIGDTDLSLDRPDDPDDEEDEFGQWHLKAALSGLVRFAEPPEGIEPDPVKAWLALTETAKPAPMQFKSGPEPLRL